MNKYYYFYDLNEILIDRYPAKISNKILSDNSSALFVFIFSEKYNDSFPSKIPQGSLSFYLPYLSEDDLKSIIKKYPPKSLTTIAQRIPDIWMLCLFNSLGIPTNVVQHGLWSDRLQRIPLVFLLSKKFKKFSQYLYYVYQISKKSRIPFYGLLNDFYYFLLKEDKNIPELFFLNNDLLKSQRIFSFDDSWDQYYIDKYGYSKNNLHYIGNPDILLLKEIDFDQKENAICYLCQSLVEDGRMLLSDYNDFLNVLVQEIPSSTKMYIKLHPRSKVDIYSIFNGLQNVVFTNDLPVCSHYIGHYTGLLPTVRHITDNILIWLFPNHHTPEYFKRFGSVLTNRKEDILLFLNKNFKNQNNDQFKKITKHELKIFDPIEKISKQLQKNIK